MIWIDRLLATTLHSRLGVFWGQYLRVEQLQWLDFWWLGRDGKIFRWG